MGRSFETGNFAAAGAGTTTFNTPLGYRAGAGGAETQQTSKSTNVTINAPSGRVTLHNASLGAGVEVSFSLLNSFVTDIDHVILTPVYSVSYDAQSYDIRCSQIGPNGFTVAIKNISGGSLSDALQINFVVIKGAVT
jgi:hypothetical protein